MEIKGERECVCVKEREREMFTDRKTDKLWYIPIMEYYTAVRLNKVQLYILTWMNLRNIMSDKTSSIR